MDPENNQQTIFEELNAQTGVLGWQELVKHFARGVLVNVDPELDLVKVAHSMSTDNTEQIQQWLERGTVRRATDDDARQWNEDTPQFWSVVVAPWVLIQKQGSAKELH